MRMAFFCPRYAQPLIKYPTVQLNNNLCVSIWVTSHKASSDMAARGKIGSRIAAKGEVHGVHVNDIWRNVTLLNRKPTSIKFVERKS